MLHGISQRSGHPSVIMMGVVLGQLQLVQLIPTPNSTGGGMRMSPNKLFLLIQNSSFIEESSAALATTVSYGRDLFSLRTAVNKNVEIIHNVPNTSTTAKYHNWPRLR